MSQGQIDIFSDKNHTVHFSLEKGKAVIASHLLRKRIVMEKILRQRILICQGQKDTPGGHKERILPPHDPEQKISYNPPRQDGNPPIVTPAPPPPPKK